MRMFAGVTKSAIEKTKGFALSQAAEFAAELAGNNYSENLNGILKNIKDSWHNDDCYVVVEDHLKNILENFNFQKWNKEKANSVAKCVVATLSKYVERIAKSGDLSEIIFEISEAVKKEIRAEKQDALLLAAINDKNLSTVRECIALGADASKYIFLTISDPEKTHLLECLLRAGVNPATTYYNGNNPSKKGFNLIAFATDCQNEAAVRILLGSERGANIAAYYPKQIEEALQGRVVNSQRKPNGGSALTVALMQAYSDGSAEAKIIAKLLLRAGAHLNIVKKGNLQEYPNYNNLQLIVHFKFEDILYEALNHELKSVVAKRDLLDAIDYCGASKFLTSSYKTADVLAETYLPDMVTVIRDVRQKLTLELEKYKILEDSGVSSVKPKNPSVVQPQVQAQRARVSEIKESDPCCCGMFGVLNPFSYFQSAKAAAEDKTQSKNESPGKIMKME